MRKIVFKSLKGFDSVGKVYKDSWKISGRKYLAAFSGKGYSADEEQIIFNYCVSVGKKSAKKAVVRNRIKRLLRQSMKECLPGMIKEGRKVPFDSFILNWREAPKHPMLIHYSDIEPEIRRVFEKAMNRVIYSDVKNHRKDS